MTGIPFSDVEQMMRRSRQCYREDGLHPFEWYETYYNDADNIYFHTVTTVKQIDSGDNVYTPNELTRTFEPLEDSAGYRIKDPERHSQMEQLADHMVYQLVNVENDLAARDWYVMREISCMFDVYSLNDLRKHAIHNLSDIDPYSYAFRRNLQDHMVEMEYERMPDHVRNRWARAYLIREFSTFDDNEWQTRVDDYPEIFNAEVES